MSHAPAQPLDTGAPRPPVHDATDLTAGGVMAHIRLNDCLYTLRITRQGRLILTK
jgi:hemin uptake protein HemP